MKLKVILATVLVNLSFAFALDSLSGTTADSSQNSTIGAATAMDNLTILTSNAKIRFLKNPCFDVKGYHFRTFRGFGFEDGVVKKFRNDGTLSYDHKKYDNLYSFLTKNNVCAPISNKYPKVDLDIQSLQIW